MTDFTLQPDSAPEPPNPTCGNCDLFIPYRCEITKRVHPSKRGRCGWKAPKFDWPMSAKTGWGTVPNLNPVTGTWPGTNAANCKCYKPK